MKCNFGVLYICLGHLGLSRKQLGKKTWSEDILRGKRKKIDGEMLMNLTWGGVKKVFCQITWQWGTVSPAEVIHGNGLEGLETALPLFSSSHSQIQSRMKMQTLHRSHRRPWHAHSYMCDGHPSPLYSGHIPPLPHYRGLTRPHMFNSLILWWRWVF